MRILHDAAKTTLAFVAGLLVGACATASPAPVFVTAAAETPQEAIAEDLETKTIALLDSNKQLICAGVWVSESAFLTAYHCIEHTDFNARYLVRSDLFLRGALQENARIPIRYSRVAATDQGHDLALFYALGNVPPHRVASVALGTLRVGSFVSTMGHPSDLGWSYASGRVAALRHRVLGGRDISWVQATVPVAAGNSGGGLFDNQDNLVGLTHGCIPQIADALVCTHLNLFVHVEHIDAFLKQHQDAL